MPEGWGSLDKQCPGCGNWFSPHGLSPHLPYCPALAVLTCDCPGPRTPEPVELFATEQCRRCHRAFLDQLSRTLHT